MGAKLHLSGPILPTKWAKNDLKKRAFSKKFCKKNFKFFSKNFFIKFFLKFFFKKKSQNAHKMATLGPKNGQKKRKKIEIFFAPNHSWMDPLLDKSGMGFSHQNRLKTHFERPNAPVCAHFAHKMGQNLNTRFFKKKFYNFFFQKNWFFSEIFLKNFLKFFFQNFLKYFLENFFQNIFSKIF